MKDNTIDLVKIAGFAVYQGSKYCELYRSSHENCKGCESEAGCARVASIMLMMTEKLLLNRMPEPIEINMLANKLAKILDPSLTCDQVKDLV